jgi:hypothetical protein
MQRSGHFHLCTVAAIGVAFPTVFYAKGLNGRIDDPNAGGKAVALEVKLGVTPVVVHFQLRPDPLAH